jgi:hypothetical protein
MQARLTTKPEQEVIAAIHALNLESVKIRLMDPKLGEGWTQEYADGIEVAYKTYLTMVARYQDHAEDILLSKDVDEFWHTHILQTMKYTEDCQSVFGQYLHHAPHIGEITEIDAARREAQAEKTRQLYQREFGSQENAESAWFGASTTARSETASGSAFRIEQAAVSAVAAGAAITARNAAVSAVFTGKEIAAKNAAVSAAFIRKNISAGYAAVSAAFTRTRMVPENAAVSAAFLSQGITAGNAAVSAAFAGQGIAAGNAAVSAAYIGNRITADNAAVSAAFVNRENPSRSAVARA